MAVTKIKPIRGTVNKALAYILDPQKFVAAYSPGQDSVIVDGFICKLETRFAEDEKNYYLAKKPFFYSGRLGKYYAFASEEERDWQRLPDIIGASIRGFAIGSKAEKGYGSSRRCATSPRPWPCASGLGCLASAAPSAPGRNCSTPCGYLLFMSFA